MLPDLPCLHRCCRRATPVRRQTLPLAAALVLAMAVVAPPSVLADTSPGSLIRQALHNIGGPGCPERMAGLILEGQGTLDLGVAMQGQRFLRPEAVAVAEDLAWLPDFGTAIGFRHRTSSDVRMWQRFLYVNGHVLMQDRLNRRDWWLADVDGNDDLRRHLRRIPHFLLREMLEVGGRLHYAGSDDRRHIIQGDLNTGERLRLELEMENLALEAVGFRLPLPLLGDSAIRWEFSDYQEVSAFCRLPARYRILVNNRVLKSITYTRMGTDVEPSMVALPVVKTSPPPGPDVREAPPPLLLRQIDTGIYLVPNVRVGYHPLVVEFSDFLVVVDAPAGDFDLSQLPAGSWHPAENAESVSRRLLAFLRARIPGKPVRFLVLTHHHADHAGGAHVFRQEDVTVTGTPETLEAVFYQSAGGADGMVAADAGSVPPIMSFPDGDVITDGRRIMRLLELPGNPHAEGMLVVWLPGEGVLYQADLFNPIPEAWFPDEARLATMAWFADWLDAGDLEIRTILSAHGTGVVSTNMLERARAPAP